MNNKLTTLELLQEIKKKLNTKQIGFWIENQDCYLWENTFHYSNKIKVGDLSMTREAWWTKWMAEFDKYYQASEIKRKILEKQFQDISDLALIEELKRRKSIKLSMYPNQEHIWITGKDIDKGGGECLPIEIERNEKRMKKS